MTTYTSPAGWYELQHPGSWAVDVDGNETSIWKAGVDLAITVSAFQNRDPSAVDDAARALESFIARQKTSRVQKGRHSSGRASMSYEDQDGDVWNVTAFCSGPLLVLASVVANRAVPSTSEDWQAALAIIESIRLL